MRQSLVIVLTAPSGAGKTTLARALLARDPKLILSVSHTTRAPRRRERDGEDYHFVSQDTFQSMVAAQAFVEHAEVHGHYYGTGRDALAKALQTHDVLVDIDWQGAAQIRAVSTYPVVDVFIAPPSLGVLATRLQQRGEDAEEVVSRRLAAARDELMHMSDFQFVVRNEDFSDAVTDLLAIIRAARLRYWDRAALLSRILPL